MLAVAPTVYFMNLESVVRQLDLGSPKSVEHPFLPLVFLSVCMFYFHFGYDQKDHMHQPHSSLRLNL